MVLVAPRHHKKYGYGVISFASITFGILHPIAKLDIRGLRLWLDRFTVCIGRESSGHYSLASIVGVEFKDMMLDKEGSDRCM